MRQIAQNLISLTQEVERVGSDNQIATEISKLSASANDHWSWQENNC